MNTSPDTTGWFTGCDTIVSYMADWQIKDINIETMDIQGEIPEAASGCASVFYVKEFKLKQKAN